MGIAAVNLSIQHCEALKQQHSKSFCWLGFKAKGEAQVLRSETVYKLCDSQQSLNCGYK